MDKKQIALGKGVPRSGVAVTKDPQTLEERISLLEEKIHAMTVAFHATRNLLKQKQVVEEINDEVFGEEPKNKDGLPLNTTLIGISKDVPYILIINDIGEYLVGNTKHASLSSAAEAVSGVRRSGWTFWKLPDGRTAKDVFRKR